MAGLVDAPRSGAPREISDQKVEEVVTKTLETTPPARTDPMFVEKVPRHRRALSQSTAEGDRALRG
jgi:hypothetical protein